MKTKIKVATHSKLNIPAQFGLDKYSECGDWSATDWLYAITYRWSLRSEWNRCVRRYYDPEDASAVYENFKRCVCALLETPLSRRGSLPRPNSDVFITDQSVADLFDDAEDDRLRQSRWAKHFRVHSTTHPMVLYEMDRDSELIQCVENTPTWVMKKDVLGQTGVATINVDLHGDDHAIVKDFRAWLKRTRTAMNLPKIKSKKEKEIFQEWSAKRVLPCFDLIFYQTVFNGRMAFPELLDELFPSGQELYNEVVDVNYLRRTIIPNSLRIISPTTVRALQNRIGAFPNS